MKHLLIRTTALSLILALVVSFAPAPTKANETRPQSCDYAVTRTLVPGMDDSWSGGQVSALQRYLTRAGYYSGPITGYYGDETVKAVQAMQRAAGIVSSGTPETTGYGAVGKSTLKYLLVHSACSGSTTPTVTSTTPATGDSWIQELPKPVLLMLAGLSERELNTFQSNSRLTVEADVDDVNLKLAGSVRLSVASEEKGEVKFGVTLSSNSSEFEQEVGTDSLTIRGTLRVIEDTVYMYFDELPELPEEYDVDTADFEKEWIEFPMDGSVPTASEASDEWFSVYEKYPFLVFTESGSTKKEYRYKITVDSSRAYAFYLNSYEGATTKEAQDFADALSSLNALLGIDKSSYLPTRLNFAGSWEDGYDWATFNFSTTFSFNKKVKIEKPRNAVLFEDLIEEIEGSGPNLFDDAAEGILDEFVPESRLFSGK